MELLVEGSKLDIPSATIISRIPETLIGATGEARLNITPSQSVADASRYSFQIQPNIPMELFPRNSFLRLQYRVKKSNGKPFKDDDQVKLMREGV